MIYSDKVEKISTNENKYAQMRNQALSVTTEQLHLNLDTIQTVVYGIVMDWGVGEAIMTVVSFQTGDASLYLNSGQIFIGGYAHENIKKAAVNFVNDGYRHLYRAILTTGNSLPDKNCVNFYLLTTRKVCLSQNSVYGKRY